MQSQLNRYAVSLFRPLVFNTNRIYSMFACVLSAFFKIEWNIYGRTHWTVSSWLNSKRWFYSDISQHPTWPESAVNIRRTTFFELPFSPGRLLIPDVYSWGHGVKYAFASDWHSSREVARSIDIRTFLHINGWFDDRNDFFFYGPGNPLWKSGALKMHSEGWFFFANSIHG